MNFTIFLSFFFLIVFITLAILMIVALFVPKKDRYSDSEYRLDRSDSNRSGWRNKVSKMLVMRPWPYKDIYNPLNRLYWPDEQPDNRAGRRRLRYSRRKR